jgi:hypothetical protein
VRGRRIYLPQMSDGLFVNNTTSSRIIRTPPDLLSSDDDDDGNSEKEISEAVQDESISEVKDKNLCPEHFVGKFKMELIFQLKSIHLYYYI